MPGIMMSLTVDGLPVRRPLVELVQEPFDRRRFQHEMRGGGKKCRDLCRVGYDMQGPPSVQVLSGDIESRKECAKTKSGERNVP
ncbi:protein of unknown function [Nitrospira japonica]|uniref:Uncharacterized protein n=1 Tax=Nitrospira japonica TaxID=1325564 RepID=A0A1W1I8P2_9BACT|nr:protein of unknown function [Nitrospira japonica]